MFSEYGKIELLLDANRGPYIPMVFSEAWAHLFEGIDDSDLEILKDPDGEWYWESWNTVLANASYTDSNGRIWTLHQDGDLFAVVLDEMSELERSEFFED